SSSSSSSPPPSKKKKTEGAPPQKPRGSGDAKKKKTHKDASDNDSSSSERPSGASPAEPAPSPSSPRELRASPGPAARGEPRPEHFDRKKKKTKLWCYAKGFNVDGKKKKKSVGSPESWRGAELRLKKKKTARRDGNTKRRRLSGKKKKKKRARPPKPPGRNSRKGNAPSCKTSPPRNSFSLMGNFPCTPSLVVGEDGDLCPASSLRRKNSRALCKGHPL
ncbi:EPOP protein, partial [Sylvietta virens]|nr:EPOP protein [Sylvietta virens]